MDKWIMYIISLLLGMLMFYILKDVCGCGNIVEGGFFGTVEKDLSELASGKDLNDRPAAPPAKATLNKCSDNNDTLTTNFKGEGDYPECLCKYTGLRLASYDGPLMTYSEVVGPMTNPKPLLTKDETSCVWREWVNDKQWQGLEDDVTATH